MGQRKHSEGPSTQRIPVPKALGLCAGPMEASGKGPAEDPSAEDPLLRVNSTPSG